MEKEIYKVNPRMDSTVGGGSSTTLANSLISKIDSQFKDVFKSKLPVGLTPCRNVEHRIELIPGANPVARPHTK